MNATYRFRWIAALTLVLWLLLAGSLSAQQEVGSLYGTVTDTEGSTLPGATLTLTGFGEHRVHTSDDQGHFRFLGLDPGAWSLEAKLAGFSTLGCQPAFADANCECHRVPPSFLHLDVIAARTEAQS